MIEPYEAGQVRHKDGEKLISYGTSSYGYDVRCSREFKVFTNINSATVDPKAFDNDSFVDVESDVCVIPPNSFALARTVEYFRIPRNVLTVCLGKSTYARCGIIVNVTPLEPEWEGHVTLDFPTPQRCQRRSTPTRALLKCCSSNPMRFARPATPIAVVSTRGKPALLAQDLGSEPLLNGPLLWRE